MSFGWAEVELLDEMKTANAGLSDVNATSPEVDEFFGHRPVMVFAVVVHSPTSVGETAAADTALIENCNLRRGNRKRGLERKLFTKLDLLQFPAICQLTGNLLK